VYQDSGIPASLLGAKNQFVPNQPILGMNGAVNKDYLMSQGFMNNQNKMTKYAAASPYDKKTKMANLE
jgi:hypothetical protein